MRHKFIKIPLTFATVSSFVAGVFSVCMFYANFQLLVPNLKKIPTITRELERQSIAINLIVKDMGLTDDYEFLLAMTIDPDSIPPVEIVEKDKLCIKKRK
jgi:hypothetical protein